jgi:molybdopterin-guanine dinucleotide biosynthesis protein A
VSTDLLNYLIKQKQDYDVVVPIHDTNKIEPLCGIYSKSIIPVMEDAVKEGNYKLRDIFKKVRFATVEIGPSLPFYSRRLFYNINKPEDIHL